MFSKPRPSTFNAGGVPQLPQHLISPEASPAAQAAQSPAATPMQASQPAKEQVPQVNPAKKVAQPDDPSTKPPLKLPSPVLLTAAHNSHASFGFEFISANGMEADALQQDFQCIYLKPSPDSQSSELSTCAIGRAHQQKAFEVWVPDTALQCCISRTAFEILCDARGGKASLIVRGQGLVCVDGKVAPRESSVPLHLRSEITFLHAVEGTMILRLRYLPASEFAEKVGNVEKVEVPTSPPPRRSVRCLADDLASDSDVRSVSARPPSARSPASGHVEGLTPGQSEEHHTVVRENQAKWIMKIT